MVISFDGVFYDRYSSAGAAVSMEREEPNVTIPIMRNLVASSK